jgi:hypothetical protein
MFKSLLLLSFFVCIQTQPLTIEGHFPFCENDVSKMPLLNLHTSCEDIIKDQNEVLIIPNSLEPTDFVTLKKLSTKYFNSVTEYSRQLKSVITSWSIFSGYKERYEEKSVDVNMNEINRMKEGLCDIGTNPYEENLEKLICLGNFCSTKNQPKKVYKWFGEHKESVIECTVKKNILIEQKSGFLKGKKYEDCEAPDLCPNEGCICYTNNVYLEWKRTKDHYFQDNYEPMLYLRKVRVKNNRLFNTKGESIMKIVGKSKDILARNDTLYLKPPRTSTKNRVKGNCFYLFIHFLIFCFLWHFLFKEDFLRRIKRQKGMPKEQRKQKPITTTTNNPRTLEFSVYITKENAHLSNDAHILEWSKDFKLNDFDPSLNEYSDNNFRNLFYGMNPNETIDSSNKMISFIDTQLCNAWKLSLNILTFFNDEFLNIQDFTGKFFQIYVTQHQIYLPACEIISELVFLNDFYQPSLDLCYFDLPVIFFYDSSSYKGYLNRVGIITNTSRLVACKDIKQLHIIPYKIENGYHTLTLRREGKNISINTNEILKYDHVDPFDYSRSHLNYKLSETIFQTTQPEAKDIAKVFIMNGSEHLNLLMQEKGKQNKEFLDEKTDIYLNVFLINLFSSILFFIFYIAYNKMNRNLEMEYDMILRKQRLD